MAALSIIGIIIFIVIAVVILKLVKSILKAIFLIFSIAAVVLFLGLFFFYSDVNDFQENFPTVPSLFLLQKDNEIIAGFYGIFAENAAPSLVEEEQLINYQQNFQEDDLVQIKGDYYKIFIIDSAAFDSVTEVKIEETISKQEVFSLLDSTNPINDYLVETGSSLDKNDLMYQLDIQNDAEFKSLLFNLLFNRLIEENDPLIIFKEYKKGNIIIYPETMMFKFVQKIPNILLNQVIQINQGE
jgi:hypothetical protein